MVQGMTGFGSAEKDNFRVEIRSVNHRFMDISVKVPHHLGYCEINIRNRIKEKFSRGKFDVSITTTGDEGVRLRANKNLAKEIYGTLESLKEELALSGAIGIEVLAGFRELLFSEDIEYSEGALFSAFNEAVVRLYEMRCKEGEATLQDMATRLGLVEKLKDRMALLGDGAAKASRQRFEERLTAVLCDAKYDEHRVLQEAAIIAERMDISEEIARIGLHIAQLGKIFSCGGTIGRKTEFILQEINREINTVASKADDYAISAIAIEIKSELEKLREQAQNMQ